MSYDAGKYDVAVIGAGHAGIEAALASARLGCRTVIFTINMDAGQLPVQPEHRRHSKGPPLCAKWTRSAAKMGKTADECTLQSRMLNMVKALRCTCCARRLTRNKYARVMKHKLSSAKTS